MKLEKVRHLQNYLPCTGRHNERGGWENKLQIKLCLLSDSNIFFYISIFVPNL